MPNARKALESPHVSVNYDSIAATYDRRYLINDYSGVEKALMAFVGRGLRGRVLEVGCGTGHWLRLLAEHGLSAAGVDASYNMLDYARAQTPGTALAHGRAEQLPWATGTFERLFCINAFHHFDDKVGFLAEARRVLAPGGQMMTVGLDPHVGIDTWYIYEYFEPASRIDKSRYAATSQIRDWMRARGFTDVRTSEVQHLPARLSARQAIEEGLLDKAATSQLAVLTDEQYRRGMDRIRRAVESAEARGETLYLSADLRLYATYGAV
jgi:ubiquinone/menaquinone biosynthesis C-methylase UbiE